MTQFEKLKSTFDEIGIKYEHRFHTNEYTDNTKNRWDYLILVGDDDYSNISFETLQYSHQFFEFCDGEIASY